MLCFYLLLYVFPSLYMCIARLDSAHFGLAHGSHCNHAAPFLDVEAYKGGKVRDKKMEDYKYGRCGI